MRSAAEATRGRGPLSAGAWRLAYLLIVERQRRVRTSQCLIIPPASPETSVRPSA